MISGRLGDYVKQRGYVLDPFDTLLTRRDLAKFVITDRADYEWSLARVAEPARR